MCKNSDSVMLQKQGPCKHDRGRAQKKRLVVCRSLALNKSSVVVIIFVAVLLLFSTPHQHGFIKEVCGFPFNFSLLKVSLPVEFTVEHLHERQEPFTDIEKHVCRERQVNITCEIIPVNCVAQLHAEME